MKCIRNTVFLALALATLFCSITPMMRLLRNGCRMATSWRCGFRSTGEYVDAARRMAMCSLARGKTIAYCCQREDGLLPVERSRILAMSWAAAPNPVLYGPVAELMSSDSIVCSAYEPICEQRLEEHGYVISDTAGGMRLWEKDSSANGLDAEMRFSVAEVFSVLAFVLLLLLLYWLGGWDGVAVGVGTVSVFEFLIATGLGMVHWGGALGGAFLAFLLAFWVCRHIVVRRHTSNERDIDCCGGDGFARRRYCQVLFVIVLLAYSTIALTHTFVAPNGLGTVGGKAKLLFMAEGFPVGFFYDSRFAPYQPAYPPGAAALTLWCYAFTGVCSEWLIQLVPCILTALLFVFMVQRVDSWQKKALVFMMFMTPLTIRLSTLFYPEIYVGLFVVLGWERIRHRPLDLIGWLMVGVSGWFKNEGAVYYVALAFSTLIINPVCWRRRFLLNIVFGLVLPFVWHVGCRLCGASLDGYAAIGQADGAKCAVAIWRFLKYAVVEPWRYAFIYTIAILACIIGYVRKMRTLQVVLLFALVSMLLFAAVFSLSVATDFDWHLDSIERLLWVPSLLLMRELLGLSESLCSVPERACRFDFEPFRVFRRFMK